MKGHAFLFTIALVAFAIIGSRVFASPSTLPENVSVRRSIRKELLSPVSQIRDLEVRQEFDPDSGGNVRIDTAMQNDSVYYLFLNQNEEGFPIASAGNWIVKRSVDEGTFVQAKIFLQRAPETFVRLFPNEATTLMDVYLQGYRLHHAIVVRAPFEELLFKPFTYIVDLTRYRVDWDLLFPQLQRPEDEHVRSLVDTIRSYLPELSDSEDGALDSDGTYRFIDDLSENLESGFNCSGFAKWIVDGMAYPIAARYFSIEAMKTKHPEIRGNEWSDVQEDDRDPYFGLDWTRNIAVAYGLLNDEPFSDFESADVRSVRLFNYIEDIGFSLDNLPAILYLLALDDPGYIYLGSVNQLFGDSPTLRQHVHVAAFFPYFDASGRFNVTVMERNLETNLESIASRYPGEHIHLVRIRAEERFHPPGVSPSDR